MAPKPVGGGEESSSQLPSLQGCLCGGVLPSALANGLSPVNAQMTCAFLVLRPRPTKQALDFGKG